MFRLLILGGIAFSLLCKPVVAERGAKPPHKGIEHAFRMSPEEEKEAIDFIKETTPRRFERLEKMKLRAPMKYKKILHRVLMRRRKLEHLKEVDPERYKLLKAQQEIEVKIWELVEEYKEADESKKQQIKTKLHKLLSELFDLREEEKEFEIKRLEKELQKLRELTEQRKKHKDEIISRHIDELLGEEHLRW